MALWPSPARQPHHHALQLAAGACPWPLRDPCGACVARSRRTAASTALRDVPRRVASASTSLRRSSGIDTITFAMRAVYRGIRDQPTPTTGAISDGLTATPSRATPRSRRSASLGLPLGTLDDTKPRPRRPPALVRALTYRWPLFPTRSRALGRSSAPTSSPPNRCCSAHAACGEDRQRPLNSGLSRLLAPGESRECWYIDDVVELYTFDVP